MLQKFQSEQSADSKYFNVSMEKNNLIWGYGNMYEGKGLRVQEARVLQ